MRERSDAAPSPSPSKVARSASHEPSGEHTLPTPARRLLALALLFAISGTGALVVETTWMRWLRDWLGATAPAAAAATTAYFAGGALGAWLGARWARRVSDGGDALRRYAQVEIGAAAGALATPLVLSAAGIGLAAVYPWIVDRPAATAALRFAVALAALLPAAAAYGATLPLIGAAALTSPHAIGSRGTALYGANVLGGACGVALAAWWAPPRLGVNGTYAIGIGLALAAALGAWWLARGDGATPTSIRRVRGQARPAWPVPPALWLAALSGFTVLAAEVLLVHVFAQIANQSVTAFGAVLIAVLGCLAAGAALVSLLRGRDLASHRRIAIASLCTAALGFAWLPYGIHRATGGLELIGSDSLGLPYALAVLASVLATAGPTLLATGCLWPAALALAGDPSGDEGGDAARGSGAEPYGGEAGARMGLLSAVNTCGAIAGGIAAPFLLLPLAGPWGGCALLALLCGVAAAALPPGAGRRRWPRAAAVAVAGVLVFGVASPLDWPLTRSVPGERVIFERSGAAGVVSVVERSGERLIRIDNHYALGGTAERVHEERQGHLPLLLHGRPQRVAFIGTATGITAGAALLHDVEQIVLVEIVPDVAAAAAEHFADANRGVYTDPRSRVVLDDARSYLRYTADRFDVITADLFVPWRAGAGALYSREHFEALRERLRAGGLVAQWLPLYQLSLEEFAIIRATFLDVFPKAALFRGDFYGAYPIVALIGWRDASAAAGAVAQAVARLASVGADDRWITHPGVFWSLYAAPLAPAAPAFPPRNRLAWPRIEFLAAARHAGGRRGKLDPLVGLDWIETLLALKAAAPRPDPLYADLPPAARRARSGGDALQLAGAAYAAGQTERAAHALHLAAQQLPESVLAKAPADASAAELWLDTPR